MNEASALVLVTVTFHRGQSTKTICCWHPIGAKMKTKISVPVLKSLHAYGNVRFPYALTFFFFYLFLLGLLSLCNPSRAAVIRPIPPVRD